MPRGGNNRIPPLVHIERGTFRSNRHRHLSNEPITFPPLAPDPPDNFRPHALAVWRELFTILTEQGVLTLAEKHLFVMYCNAQGDYLEARERVTAEGYFRKPQNGRRVTDKDGIQYSKWFRLMIDREAVATRLASLMGITPVDRQRVAKVAANKVTEIMNARPKTVLDLMGTPLQQQTE